MFTYNTKQLNMKMALLASNCTLVVFFVVLFLCNCYPFGDNTFLMFDMKRQYIDYDSYLSSVLCGDNNVFYSFSTTLGSGIFGFFTYYLTSPFLVILFLFPKALLPLGIEIVIGIKLAVAAFVMNLFLQRFFDVDYVTVICSVSWALSSYLFAHSMNMMWIDVVILLPLIIWSLEKFFYSDKYKVSGVRGTLSINIPYICCVFAILYLNYYISYQVFLFLLLWSVMRLFTLRFPNKKYKILQISFNTVLGILLDAAFIAPTAIELVNSPKDITKLGLELTGRNLSPFEVFSKLGTMSYDMEEARFGGPQIFCGILFLVLTVMFFMNRNIDKKERIGIGALFTILLLSFCIDLFDLFWHAGMEPSGHPYRQAFLWIFLCVLCSCRMLICIKNRAGSQVDKTSAYKFVGISFVIVALIYVFSLSKRYDHVSNITIVASWAILVILAALMIVGIKLNNSKVGMIISVIIVLVQISDITSNAVYTYNYQSVNNTHMSEYSSKVSSTDASVKYIKAKDNSFYRMENLTPRQQNDAMQYSYNGVTHYSSAGMTYVRDFLQNLGYNDDTLYTNYGYDNTVLADCILGIKYLISDGKVLTHPEYSKVQSDTSGSILENVNALPVAVGVNDFVSPTKEEINQMNPFSLQENIVSQLAGEKVEVFVKASATEETYTENGNICCRYTVTPSLSGELYLYIEGIGDINQGLAIEVDDEFKSAYGNEASMKVLNLGQHVSGESIVVDVIGDSFDSKLGKAVFVTEDLRAIEDIYHKLKSKFTSVTCETSSHLKITTPNCNGVFMTIPYENGWEVTVDGIKTKPVMVYDSLMYIPIASTADSHYIDMQFTPVGFNLGLIISIITLGIILLLILKDIGVMDEKEVS